MKFAHEYETALTSEGFPTHWVQSAIAYRQLKKCIKKVELELSGIGLDASTLRQLWQSINDPRDSGRPFQYKLEGDITTFEPKLIFLVNSKSGIPIDACLSPETRAYLQSLTINTEDLLPPNESASAQEAPPGRGKEGSGCAKNPDNQAEDESGSQLEYATSRVEDRGGYHRVEVPLRHDHEFFQMLRSGVLGINTLQMDEKAELTKEIESLGREIAKIATPSHNSGCTDMYLWRDIFALYTNSQIFFSTSEQDEHTRDVKIAEKQLESFSKTLRELINTQKFRRKDSCLALDRFLHLNIALFRHLRFQELNTKAMTKILKKFDKRTALGVRQTFADLEVAEAFLSQTMAKSMCFKISEELISVVPQLNDYLCPVCFNISFKPIRLSCGHVFCIRCMIVMQRAGEDHCPLCRGSVVMQANSGNLDPALMNFLTKFFPREVRVKQKENERDMGIDQYGKEYSRCSLM